MVFTCGFDDPTGAFGAAIGRSLDLIHEYARLALPTAYLERFETGVAGTPEG